KANNSSTSNRSTLARVPNRPATKAAWATRTSPPSNSGRASCSPIRSASSFDWSRRQIAAPGGAGTRAVRLERDSNMGRDIEGRSRKSVANYSTHRTTEEALGNLGIKLDQRLTDANMFAH